MRVSFLIRVVLPDRPGALGAVASALGHAGADILSVDIVERSAGQATDDLVVELPADRLADSLVTRGRQRCPASGSNRSGRTPG